MLVLWSTSRSAQKLYQEAGTKNYEELLVGIKSKIEQEFEHNITSVRQSIDSHFIKTQAFSDLTNKNMRTHDQNLIDQFVKSNPNIIEVTLIDNNGIVWASSSLAKPGQILAGKSFYQTALTEGASEEINVQPQSWFLNYAHQLKTGSTTTGVIQVKSKIAFPNTVFSLLDKNERIWFVSKPVGSYRFVVHAKFPNGIWLNPDDDNFAAFKTVIHGEESSHSITMSRALHGDLKVFVSPTQSTPFMTDYLKQYQVLLLVVLLLLSGGFAYLVAWATKTKKRKPTPTFAELFEIYFQSIPMPVLAVTPDGRIKQANRFASVLFTREVGNLQDQMITRWIPKYPDSEHQLDGMEVKVVQKGSPSIPVSLTFQDIKLNNQLLTLVYVQDISSDKKVEHIHQYSIDSVPAGVLLLNQAGNIELMNRYAASLFGSAKNTLAGQNSAGLIAKRHKKYFLDRLKYCFEHNTAEHITHEEIVYIVDHRQKEMAVDINFSVINSKRGKFILATFVEISESDIRARSLQTVANELSRSNEELEKFALAASHDLKAPLRAINNLAQWVTVDAEEVLPSESKEHLHQMQERVKRMGKMLDDMLAYSKAGQAKEDVETVDVKQLVSEVVDFIGSDKQVKVHFGGKMPVFKTFKTPLMTVFRNLISNAIKHHNQNKVGMAISCNQIGGYYEFLVADDGPGIPEEHQQRIFEMFKTLKPKDETGTSGMGLAIVKRIIDGFNASITVESSPGKGTTFKFTWPIQLEK